MQKLASAIQLLKQKASQKLKKKEEEHFWLPRYYDFNVWSEAKPAEKLHYMHHNPVVRGLVEKPGDWPWSSYTHYQTGAVGTVEIESHWTQWRREHGNLPATPHIKINQQSSKSGWEGS